MCVKSHKSTDLVHHRLHAVAILSLRESTLVQFDQDTE